MGKYKSITVQFEDRDYDQIKAIAKANDWSRAKVTQKIVERELKKQREA